MRTTVGEIFLSSWRSSQTIWRTQNCLQAHTVLRTLIRNVLRKWLSKSRKHSIYTHFPKDRNCEVCLRTKMTTAPCRRRTGGAVPRAQNFGDLITADHKVLSEGCESRNNHRYAIVVQDLATQMDPVVSVQNKNFSINTKELAKSSWSQIGSLKSFTLSIPWNLAKPVKIFLGIIVRRHHTDREHMGLLREQYAE